MAINVKTRTIGQSQAKATTFGYNPNISTAGADALSRNLQGVASDLSSLKQKMDRKAKVADDILGKKQYTDATVGLSNALNDYKNVLGTGTPEERQAAKARLDAYNPEVASFSFGDTSEFNNSSYMEESGYKDQFRLAFSKANITATNTANQYKIVDELNVLSEDSNKSYWVAASQSQNGLFNEDVFAGVQNKALALLNSSSVEGLSSKDVQQQYLSRASNDLRRLYVEQIKAADTPEQVKRLTDRFEGLIKDGQVLNMRTTDKNAIINGGVERIADIKKGVHKEAKARVSSAVTKEFNGLNVQLNLDVDQVPDNKVLVDTRDRTADLLAEAEANPDVIESDTVRDKLLFAHAATQFLIRDGSGVSPQLAAAIDAVMEAEESQEDIKIDLPDSFDDLRPESVNKLRANTKELAEYIREEALQKGDTYTVLKNILGEAFNEPANQANILKAIGLEGETTLNVPRSEFNLEDPASSTTHLASYVGENSSRAVVSHSVKKLNDSKATESEILEQFALQALVNTGQDFNNMDPAQREVAIQQSLDKLLVTYKKAERFGGQNEVVETAIYNMYIDQMDGSLSHLMAQYDSLGLINQRTVVEDFIKGMAVGIAETKASELRERLPKAVIGKGDDVTFSTETLFNIIPFDIFGYKGGTQRRLRNELKAAEESFINAFGSVADATNYNNATVAIFPKVLKEFYNYNLGKKTAQSKAFHKSNELELAKVSAFMNDGKFGLSQETLANNIYDTAIDVVVENRAKIQFTDSLTQQLRNNGVSNKVLNAIDSDKISDSDLKELLLEATVKNKAGNRIGLFDFSQQSISKDNENVLVTRVFDPSLDRYVEFYLTDRSQINISEDRILEDFSEKKDPADFYTFEEVIESEMSIGSMMSPL